MSDDGGKEGTVRIEYAKHHVTPDDEKAVLAVLRSDFLTCGPKVAEFERAFAEKCGAEYCVAVSSGTAALHLAYLACGVGPKKKVLTSPVSFVATANAALYCGAKVKFYDWPSEGVCPKRPWFPFDVVVPVSLGGDPRYATVPHAAVILDTCHGPFYLPSDTEAACFSFHPCKHIAAGEGGAIVTNNPLMDVVMRQARNHGSPVTKRVMFHMGFNYRLSDIHAALALSQLKRLDWNIERRRELARWYDEAFKGKVGVVPHSEHSARHLYQILLDNRNEVRSELLKRGIGTQVHYEPIIPLQPYYRERFGYKPGQFPNAERYAARTLSLPLYPTLAEFEQDYIIKNVLEVV